MFVEADDPGVMKLPDIRDLLAISVIVSVERRLRSGPSPVPYLKLCCTCSVLQSNLDLCRNGKTSLLIRIIKVTLYGSSGSSTMTVPNLSDFATPALVYFLALNYAA